MVGIINMDRTDPSYFVNIKNYAGEALRQRLALALNTNKSQICVRDLIIGAPSCTTDWVDLEYLTAATANKKKQIIDATSITAYTFSSVLAAGETVPDNKMIAFFGFWDQTVLANGVDLDAIRFKRGADVLDIWKVDDMYPEGIAGAGFVGCQHVRGIVSSPNDIIVYNQNDPVTIEMRFDTAADKTVGLYGVIAERWGTYISNTASVPTVVTTG
jgi:hypothetical protein